MSFLSFAKWNKFPDNFFDDINNLKYFICFVAWKKNYKEIDDWYKCSNKILSVCGFDNKINISELLNKVYEFEYFIESEFQYIKKRNCRFIGCGVVRPTFNYIGNTKGLYCAHHKLEGMIDIRSKKCEHKDCEINPTFNFKGEKAKYCFTHKLEGMIDVKTKKCKNLNCNTQPIYGYTGGNVEYCFIHKLEGMLDIRSKKCEHQGCNTQPTYGFKEGKVQYCPKHKLEGMFNIKHKKCENIDCEKHPSYGFEGEKPRFCFDHKLDGMEDIKSKKCEYPECKKRTTYNYEGLTEAIYCSTHKKPGMIDVKNKLCKTPLCYVHSRSKFEGYCLFCYINTFPDRPVSRNYKTKEKAISDFIKENFKEYDIILDKKISEGCSKRRPDVLIELGHRVIIIEIDENQHINYDCSCENKRIMEIYQDVEHRPIVFIRFNPDNYINEKGKLIKSCWGTNDTGILRVDKNKKKEWNERLEALKGQVKYWIENESEKAIEVIQLYYDLNLRQFKL